jgi:predicted DCC family thiol-disulfide oxidoreductase YuxK
MIARATAWFEREYQTDADSLAVVRVFYCLLLLIAELPRWLWISKLPASFYQPPLGLASFFASPPPSWFFYALNAIVVAGAVCLLFGHYSRTAAIVIAAGLFVGNSFGFAFGKIDHDWLLIGVPIAGLAAGWGGRERVVAWPIALIALAIGCGMFYAGSGKVMTGWLSIDHLAVRTTVIDNALANQRFSPVSAFAVNTWPLELWELMDWGVVLFECAFIVTVLKRRWFLLACATATGFHFANAAMMELQFACNLPAYAMAAHWTVPAWIQPAVLSRRVVTTAAVATAAVYCVIGNPAWLFVQGMGWEVSNAPQWPFTALALLLAAAWLVRESGIFTVSRPISESQLTGLRMDERCPIVLFDGYCGLCNGWVDLVMRVDRRGDIRFLPLQTKAGAALLSLAGLEPTYTESILLVYRGRAYTHSSAILYTLVLTGSVWALTAPLFAIPVVVRDAVYRAVASRRYRWFGRSDTCRIPTTSERKRFLSID